MLTTQNVDNQVGLLEILGNEVCLGGKNTEFQRT